MRRASPCARTLLFALLAGSYVAACADGAGSHDEQTSLWDQEQGETRSTANGSPHFSAFEATADAGTASPDGGPASANPAAASTYDAGLDYSDQQILGVVLAMHDAQIVLATAARWNATDPRVQSLGDGILTAHNEGRSRALSLNTLPIPSDQSVIYFEAGLTLRATLLRQDRGETYDDAYLNVQIMLDAILVHQIETIWLPMADAPEVQAALQATRDTLQSQLDRAVGLRTEREAARPSAPTDPDVAEPSDEAPPTSQQPADDGTQPAENVEDGTPAEEVDVGAPAEDEGTPVL